jgi:cytochrome c-type biogenesis protein CcmH
MTTFVLIAALMALVTGVLLTRPLWRRAPAPTLTPSDDATALAATREQLRQLDALHGSGALTEAQASEARQRLQQRLGSTLAPAPQSVSAHIRRPAATLATLCAFVAVVAAAGYLLVGAPLALDPEVRLARGGADAANREITAEQIEAMVEKLAARLKEKPDDPEGWAMLGRSYAVLGRHAQALPAFKQAMTLKPDDPVLIADYADALAVTNGRNLEGEPSRLIARALELDPNNLKALSLAGTAAFLRKDYALAQRHWEKMVKLEPDSAFTRQIQGGIDEAKRMSAGGAPADASARAPASPAPQGPSPSAAGAASVSGVVKLAAALAGKAAPEDTLFVYARAAQGPRMPLAILRKQVKDLPLKFTLDDSMAMSPAARLSSAQQVVVSARISKRGEAMPQPGDLLGQTEPVAPGASGLLVEIAQIVGQ